VNMPTPAHPPAAGTSADTGPRDGDLPTALSSTPQRATPPGHTPPAHTPPAPTSPGPTSLGTTSLGAIDKAMLVLACVSRRAPIKLSDIARQTGLPKSTVHRLLSVLEMNGALQRARTGYVLGDMIRRLSEGNDEPRRDTLRRVLMPHMAELYETTRLPTTLAVLDGLTVVCLLTLYPRNLAAPVLRSPQRIPVHRSALGRLLLAYSPAAPLQLPEGELARIRRRGIAFNPEEHISGMAGIAAPVTDLHSGVAAIGIAGPPEQLGGTEIEPLLRRTAHEALLTLKRHRRLAI
jgi:IclR family transcriptional regulator, acetate operon repressor